MAEIDIQFGKRIRQLRKDRRWSQARVAKKLEVDRVTYTNIENGKQKITLAHAVILSDILKFSLDELIRKVQQVSQKKVLRNESKDVHLAVDKILYDIRNSIIDESEK